MWSSVFNCRTLCVYTWVLTHLSIHTHPYQYLYKCHFLLESNIEWFQRTVCTHDEHSTARADEAHTFLPYCNAAYTAQLWEVLRCHTHVERGPFHGKRFSASLHLVHALRSFSDCKQPLHTWTELPALKRTVCWSSSTAARTCPTNFFGAIRRVCHKKKGSLSVRVRANTGYPLSVFNKNSTLT